MSTTPKGKSFAIIAYITFVGMIIAYFMNKEEKYEFATWHIKNMFGLFLILIISQVSFSYVNELLGDVLWWIALASWVFGLIMAAMNKKKGIPILSEKFQAWFTFLN